MSILDRFHSDFDSFVTSKWFLVVLIASILFTLCTIVAVASCLSRKRYQRWRKKNRKMMRKPLLNSTSGIDDFTVANFEDAINEEQAVGKFWGKHNVDQYPGRISIVPVSSIYGEEPITDASESRFSTYTAEITTPTSSPNRTQLPKTFKPQP